MDLSQPSDESRVLIIYTGGTIGMLVGPQGYRNEPHFLTETLRCQSRFHDPLEDSLFSHSGTIEGYRKWSTSGKASPTAESPVSKEVPTLLVRSTRPIMNAPLLGSEHRLPPAQNIECKKTAENVYECMLPSLVTPRSSIHSGNTKRIRFAILEWDPLLDSSDVDTDDWIRIATEIELNYASFDAFVVLHGTDTMSYTSSALSFMLEDLGKTVILTGAQIPLSQLRNDAVDNLLGALSIAGHYIIPECCVFFNQALYRGNRVSKQSSYDFNAFGSPNFAPLVNVGIDIMVDWNNVIRQTSLRRFRAHKDMNSRVGAFSNNATLRLFPGITAETVRAFLLPPIQGVVLETFGAGNAPQRSDLMAALREASDRGIVIVAISQCSKGTVSGAYETGRTLLNAGVVPGGDMTPECALTKLGYLLSKPELSVKEVRDLLRLSIRGELTPAPNVASKPSIANHTGTMQDIFTQMVRLASAETVSSSNIPEIVISPSTSRDRDQSDQNKDGLNVPAAPWSLTAAEANATEASLLPFLVHLAVARDDVEGLTFCLDYENSQDPIRSPTMERRPSGYAAGFVNSIEPSSGRSPLHVAAFNGSERCLSLLLHAGAIVHLRDSLGHTALYYAARRGHLAIVAMLRQAGANLGGSDIDGGFARHAVKKALQWGDESALDIWTKAGFDVSNLTTS